MTLQESEVTGDLTVVSSPSPQVWFAGTPQDDLDDRLELTRPDDGTPIAIRDARHPSGPALRFSPAEWDALRGRTPNLVDLR